MGKGVRRGSAKGRPIGEEVAAAARPEQRLLPVVELLVQAGVALRELVIATGTQVLARMLEEDREASCGERYRHDGQRRSYRHGYEQGQAILGGRKISLRKPRVRTVAGSEVPLPTWEALQREDLLRERVLEQMMIGVSTRNYERSLEELPAGMRSIATKKSSVSRRFVARTNREVTTFLTRSIEGLDLPVVMIDGTYLGDHMMLVALGVDRTGAKHVLAVREGTTESHAVCHAMLRDLIHRGLEVERPRLFVIDGGKGIRKAIVTTFGSWALIQRCQLHKMRNVLEHLPKAKQDWMRRKLGEILADEDAERGRAALERLAESFQPAHPGAAASLREGLDEMFSVTELGLSEALHKSLRSTNLIENVQGRVKTITRRVKRWRGGSMALRWVVSACMEAERKFRRIRGHQDMPTLLAALERRATALGLAVGEETA